jgi:hypothetical protein
MASRAVPRDTLNSLMMVDSDGRMDPAGIAPDMILRRSSSATRR